MKQLVKHGQWLKASVILCSIVLFAAGVVGIISLNSREAHSSSVSWRVDAVYEVTQGDSETPGVTAPLADYSKALVSDQKYLTTDKSTVDKGFDGQVYKVYIERPALGFGEIIVHWSGFGEPSPGYPVRVDVYNQNTHVWELSQAVQTETLDQNVAATLNLVADFDSSTYLAPANFFAPGPSAPD